MAGGPSIAAGPIPASHSFRTKSSLAVPGIMMGTSNAPGFTQTKKLPTGENTGRWTKEEHTKFLEGLKLHGKEWKKISNMIDSRTVVQIRTHAQKYFQKLAKSAEQQGHEVPGDLMSTARNVKTPGESSSRRRSPYAANLSRQASASSISSNASAAFAFDGARAEVPIPLGHASAQRRNHARNPLQSHRISEDAMMPLESPRNGATSSGAAGGVGRLTIMPELTYNPIDTFAGNDVDEVYNLKWLDHGFTSGRLPDASPTGVADLDFGTDAEDIGALFAPSPVSVTSSRRPPVAAAAQRAETSSSTSSSVSYESDDDAFDGFADTSAFDHISESLMTSGGESADHDRECDILSSVDGSEVRDHDLEPQPELSGSGPFTDYVFGSGDDDADADDFLEVSTSSNASSPCSPLSSSLDIHRDLKRRRLDLE
ncbi:Myb family DNA-binding protein, SHAQKYF family [Hondaea fermentalgiana]|uniref:Myb family DNA-binding protein, SHAQKYF family n=1 Tax=Hondaea fermentalgiana TaxID=2315210 RepID=A0A2R5GNG8_9STRA|nr:Myb family DNA-binding protein, SHAQKYF family [Hondaea fermentalgiana]|eukprot:GBG32437.1 Myb family DNA-binding protein, SHAQKYF family [Hondaea fermentalgiana]